MASKLSSSMDAVEGTHRLLDAKDLLRQSTSGIILQQVQLSPSHDTAITQGRNIRPAGWTGGHAGDTARRLDSPGPFFSGIFAIIFVQSSDAVERFNRKGVGALEGNKFVV